MMAATSSSFSAYKGEFISSVLERELGLGLCHQDDVVEVTLSHFQEGFQLPFPPAGDTVTTCLIKSDTPGSGHTVGKPRWPHPRVT